MHTPATTASEMAWLRALREETELGVPEPVAARDGALTVTVDGRVCVLLRWVEGRFIAAGLQPVLVQRGVEPRELAHVPGFTRPRVDALTSAAKAACVRDVEPVPSEADGRAAPALIEAHWRLRLLQLVRWMIESREHPGFRDRWRGWVRADLAELARLGSAA